MGIIPDRYLKELFKGVRSKWAEHDARPMGGWLALSPLLVFLCVYLVSSVLANDFYKIPISASFLIASIYAIAICRGKTLEQRIAVFSDGAGNKNVLLMIWIFVLAGAFAATAKEIGAIDATVNLALRILPGKLLYAGLFLASCFISMSIGTSVGTIVALVPVAAGIAEELAAGGSTGVFSSPAFITAIRVGGSFFGDNLSFISDTTIAATRTQGVEMKDKFRVNAFIAAPAAIVTVVLLVIFGQPETVVPLENVTFDIIKVIPYILVLGLAIIGLNVFLVLVVGIFSAAIIGFAYGELTILAFGQNVYNGFIGMAEVFFLSLLMGGLSNMVTKQGGIDWMLKKIQSFIKGPASAQVGIAALTAAADMATANNTVSIIVCGPIAKSISAEYKIDPRKTASILDIVSCVFQGAIPWGAQILTAGSLVALSGLSISPMEIIPNLWYQGLLLISLIVSFVVPFADGVIKNDPWNWEYDKAQSKVKQ